MRQNKIAIKRLVTPFREIAIYKEGLIKELQAAIKNSMTKNQLQRETINFNLKLWQIIRYSYIL